MAFFRTRTDTGVFQLSDDRVYFSLDSVGFINNNDAGWGTAGTPQVATRTITFSGVTESDRPMLAVRSGTVSTWAFLDSSTASSVTYRLYRNGSTAPGGTFDYWLFTSNSPPPPSSGPYLILRNESGDIVFSSQTPVARIMGILDESGYSGLPTAGRTLAHVGRLFGQSSFRIDSWGQLGSCSQGTSGGPGYRRYTQTGSAIILCDLTGSTPEKDQEGFQTGRVPLNCDSQRGQTISFSTSGLANWSTIILDVSNY